MKAGSTKFGSAKEKRIHVIVTDRDIVLGVPKGARDCALARAISRAMGRPVWVSNRQVWLCFENDPLCPLPTAAKKFLHASDDGERVEPIEFDLTIKSKTAAMQRRGDTWRHRIGEVKRI